MFSYSRRDTTEFDLSCGSSIRAQRIGSQAIESPWARGKSDQLGAPSLAEIARAFRQGFVCAVQGVLITAELAAWHVGRPCLAGVFLEGAAMACGLLDAWTPWKKDRWHALLASAGDRHVFEIHVGLGMALARANQRLEPWLRDLDPVLRWLVVDGYGFHHGFFEAEKYLKRRDWPRQRIGKGHQRKVFDQGLGRSLWFACAADVCAVIAAVKEFPPARQRELWSGVGVAASMVGGASQEQLSALCRASGRHRSHLAQGAAFAAHVRERAGSLADHTSQACTVLAGVSPAQASAAVERAFRKLSAGGPKHLHESWQTNVRNAIARHLPEA